MIKLIGRYRITSMAFSFFNFRYDNGMIFNRLGRILTGKIKNLLFRSCSVSKTYFIYFYF